MGEERNGYAENIASQQERSAHSVAAAICRHGRCVYAENSVLWQKRRAHSVAAAFKAAMNETYTQKNSILWQQRRAHPVAAAIRRHGRCVYDIQFRKGHGAAATARRGCVLLTELHFVYAMPMAADCRRYGGRAMLPAQNEFSPYVQ